MTMNDNSTICSLFYLSVFDFKSELNEKKQT